MPIWNGNGAHLSFTVAKTHDLLRLEADGQNWTLIHDFSHYQVYIVHIQNLKRDNIFMVSKNTALY